MRAFSGVSSRLVTRRRFLFCFFALVSIPFLVAFPYVRALNNPNELVRVYTVMALFENHTYRVDEQVENLGHTEDLARVNGHYAMVKAPGVVHLGLPAYALFSAVIAPVIGLRYPVPALPDEDAAERARLDWTRGATWTLRLLTSQLPCLLFLIWLERYLRAHSRDVVLRCATVVAAGLGTNFLAYAHMFASHSLHAVAAFYAFARTEEALRGRRSRWRAACVGFALSACVALEYQSLFMSVVLAVFALRAFGRGHTVPLVAGGAANVPLVMWFQHCAYGHAFLPGHKLIENAKFAAEHRTGLFGIALPSWRALRALAIDPGFGFLALSPFMWLGVAAVGLLAISPRRRGDRTMMLAFCAAMAAVILVNAGFAEWRAGWTVGPRYLVVCAPFFAFGGLLFLERASKWSRRVARGAAIGLAFSGVIAVGTVGLIVDTLPDTIGRPFAQFVVPMLRAGFVAHDIGEWFGAKSGALWYLSLGVLLITPLALFARRGRPSVAAFLLSTGIGLSVPLASDAAPLWELHPSVAFFARDWEPARPAGRATAP